MLNNLQLEFQNRADVIRVFRFTFKMVVYGQSFDERQFGAVKQLLLLILSRLAEAIAP
jgi:hypothetical protein